MTIVPPKLRTAFDDWDDSGRKPQSAFEWNKAVWEKRLPDFADMLRKLPNPIDRSGVTTWFTDIDDEAAAERAYLASYVWGYASANFGPFRAHRAMTANPTFASDLLEVAKIAQTEGGIAAFQHVVDEKGRNNAFFKFYRPAFATKFIYFATKAAPDVETTPIMDSIVCAWFAANVEGVRLYPSWNSSNSYRTYVDHASQWAAELGIEIDDVEWLIFRSHGSKPTPS